MNADKNRENKKICVYLRLSQLVFLFTPRMTRTKNRPLIADSLRAFHYPGRVVRLQPHVRKGKYMSETEDRMHPFKPGDRCNIEQYKMLIRCSKNNDISEWNEWRDKNTEEKIWLAGANLRWAKLQGAKLRHANLQGAELMSAELQGADRRRGARQGISLFSTALVVSCSTAL